MKNKKVRYITQAAIVAALYVVLTMFTYTFASGAIQIRLSEALCILPYFMPSAIPGLFVGCIISNLLLNGAIWDVVFGSLATLIGAIIASKIKNKYLLPLPNIIANCIVVPIVIFFVYTDVAQRTWPTYFVALGGVFAGEVISAYILGLILFAALEKHKERFK